MVYNCNQVLRKPYPNQTLGIMESKLAKHQLYLAQWEQSSVLIMCSV